MKCSSKVLTILSGCSGNLVLPYFDLLLVLKLGVTQGYQYLCHLGFDSPCVADEVNRPSSSQVINV